MLLSYCIEYFERASLTMALGKQRLNYSLSQKSHAAGQSKASHTLNIVDGLYFGPKMYIHLFKFHIRMHSSSFEMSLLTSH